MAKSRDETPKQRRTYAGEMFWAISQAKSRNHDRNPNRYAQVTAALDYGHIVNQCRLGHESLPSRPDLDRAI
jgi:hypothetical protein